MELKDSRSEENLQCVESDSGHSVSYAVKWADLSESMNLLYLCLVRQKMFRFALSY